MAALVAAQATAPKGERAVVTSTRLILPVILICEGLRNFFRNLGGAFGLTSNFLYLKYLTYQFWGAFSTVELLPSWRLYLISRPTYWSI
jgi:hypothetical protein